MIGKVILVICVQTLFVQKISAQYIPNAEIIGPGLLPEGISVAEGMAINSNLALGPNIAHGPNIPPNNKLSTNLAPNIIGLNPSVNNLGLSPNLAPNIIGLGPNIAPNLSLGNNLAASNLALASNWPSFGQTPWQTGLGPGFGSIPPALAPGVGIAASNGGCFTVTSSSPIAPTGLTVTSENTIEGALAITGQLPFLGTVGMDGAFPTAGGGAVSYGCGDGAIGIVSEGVAPVRPMAAAAAAPALGYGTGIPAALPFNVGSQVGFGGLGYGALY